MYAICVESSHSRGMGHLFRMLNFSAFLDNKSINYVFVLNQNIKAQEILKKQEILYVQADFADETSDWERFIIQKYSITHWINDRLETSEKHARNVVECNCKLITFDDLGDGARFSDINICGLFFFHSSLLGKKVLKGVDYLILNSEIDRYKRLRTKTSKILVTLGGSDTYGVTLSVLSLLKKQKLSATIHVGPSFEHFDALEREITEDFQLIYEVPSLIEAFASYDLAITGGGITPFEANASGLPCLIIANELFEIPNGRFLNDLGSSVFLGYYEELNDAEMCAKLEGLDIEKMSTIGMQRISTSAIQRIMVEIDNI